MSRRLGVLGTLVRDRVFPPGQDSPLEETWGGIAYSLAAFEVASPRGWGQLPIVKVGQDVEELADAFLADLRTVTSTEGVRVVPAPNNRVELRYRDRRSRTEILAGGVPGWRWEELRPLALSCDALYVNFIAGWELDLEGARALRRDFDAPLYGDLHSLLLGRTEDGTRVPRPPADWRRWVECFDYLQVNHEELRMLAGTETRDPWELAEDLVRGELRAVFVTRGPDGAAWRARRGGIDEGSGSDARGDLPVPEPVEESDPTGCGDVWGMTCFSAILEGAPLEQAVERAHRTAGANARTTGAEAFLDVGRGRVR
ncbi:MAG: carbohydrate kinase family protein [Gemmatimonadota bacterium]